MANHEKEDLVWYFAYGSNMSRTKFTGSRGIVPIDAVNVVVPGWQLTMEVPGMPYSEPGMGSISRIEADEGDDAAICEKPHSGTSLATSAPPDPHSRGPVHGVAYLVTAAQYVSIIRSEGGGIAYDDVALDATRLASSSDTHDTPGPPPPPPQQPSSLEHPDQTQLSPSTLTVRTLVNVPAMRRAPEPLPSARYKGLLVTGATEAGLPATYLSLLNSWPAYEPVPPPGRDDGPDAPSWTRYVGALVFLAIWAPLLAAMEKLCYATIDDDTGLCPLWVRLVVRWAVAAIWWSHDVGFAPIFGRGDGYDGDSGDGRTGGKAGGGAESEAAWLEGNAPGVVSARSYGTCAGGRDAEKAWLVDVEAGQASTGRRPSFRTRIGPFWVGR